ncbi:embigin-like isoform X1 [Leucoraja erinacea]|uniref:embigin-like isoform X1 n=1 Tax=Leucoraja erinaceus TaxID=7782 RepID=UPI002455B758|nr:embigin-like isoform X1 [Leucoraja erinacea]XP_055489796.1 embigin-like isoform X1 [Leucoraja erinacea]
MIGPLGKQTLSAILLIISIQGVVEPSNSHHATSAPVSRGDEDRLSVVEIFLLLGFNETKKVNITMATKIRLSCNLTILTTKESPTIGTWKKDGNEIGKEEVVSVQKEASLSHEFDFQNGSDAGNYSCIFDTHPKLEGRFEVQIPPIWAKSVSLTRSTGDQVNLTCGSDQYAPLNWIWSKEAQSSKVILSNETEDFYIHSNVNKSTLSIKSIIMDDTAYYRCSAHYAVGDSTLRIYLKVHGLTAAIIPFLCIVAEVLVLVVVILACERKMKQKEEPIEDVIFPNNLTTEELLESTENGARHRNV